MNMFRKTITKRRLIQKVIFLIIIISYSNKSLRAQSEKRSNFIGINPSVTIEPFYEKGELDINIFPIVYQTPMSKILDLRLTSILNLGIRNEGNEISHFGLETALPIFFKAKLDKKESSKGFFVAPIVSLTRNRIEEHNNVGLWVEPGYHLLFDNNFAMSFGLQFGGTYFSYDNGQTKWGNHFGVKIIFGKWI
jgi:hypothetical protein